VVGIVAFNSFQVDRDDQSCWRLVLIERRWRQAIYCSLHCRIKGAEKTGPVLLGRRGGSAGIRSQLPQMPGYLTTGKRVSYIRLRPLVASRGDDPREFLEAA
jgi:hypothetical protein